MPKFTVLKDYQEAGGADRRKGAIIDLDDKANTANLLKYGYIEKGTANAAKLVDDEVASESEVVATDRK